MKVFVVTELSIVDCSTDITTELFATEEKAREYFNDRIEVAKNDASDDMVTEESENSFEIYEEGYATDWSVSITISEKEVR